MSTSLIPDISFDESNVGARPARVAAVDRIGFVGTFKRGPVTPQIVDADQAEAMYAFTDHVGSAHLQAVTEQGANDFVIMRVMPKAQKASLLVKGVGTAAGTAGTAVLKVTDAAALVTSVTVPVAIGDTGSVIFAKLATEANLTPGLAVTAVATALNVGTTGEIKLEAKQPGSAGNEIKAELDFSAGTTGVVLDPSTLGDPTSLAGGSQPTAAFTEVGEQGDVDNTPAVIRGYAAFPGLPGNNLSLTISQGSETDLRDVKIDLAEEELSFTVTDVDFTDTYQDIDGRVLATAFRTNLLMRLQVLEANKVPAIGTYSFSGGAEGFSGAQTKLTTADYIAAIDALEEQQCTIVLCPGLKEDGVLTQNINAHLVAQAEKIDTDFGEEQGLRIAVVGAPRTTTVMDLAALKASGRIPDSKRAVMVVGWGTLARRPNFRRFGIDPAAPYAGHLMGTPVQVSPAARSSIGAIQGITEVDTPTGRPALNQITAHRLEALIFDDGLRCLNGRSTSSDSAWYWICYRRVTDKVRTDLYFLMRFVKSEPSSELLDARVQDTGNGYLQGIMYSRVVAGYDPLVSNESNNPPAIRGAGQRFADFGLEYIPPNDKTKIRLNRTQRASVRLR